MTRKQTIFRSGIVKTIERGLTLDNAALDIKKHGSLNSLPIPGLNHDDMVTPYVDPDELATKKAFKVLAEILLKARDDKAKKLKVELEKQKLADDIFA